MSAYVTAKTQYKDPAVLVEALHDLGYVVEQHAEAQTLIDYHGNPRPQRAEIIIRRQHVGAAANDVGFARQSDGTYSVIISQYDRGATFTTEVQNRLRSYYATRVVTKAAKAKGYSVAAQTSANGQTKLVLRRFA